MSARRCKAKGCRSDPEGGLECSGYCFGCAEEYATLLAQDGVGLPAARIAWHRAGCDCAVLAMRGQGDVAARFIARAWDPDNRDAGLPAGETRLCGDCANAPDDHDPRCESLVGIDVPARADVVNALLHEQLPNVLPKDAIERAYDAGFAHGKGSVDVPR